MKGKMQRDHDNRRKDINEVIQDILGKWDLGEGKMKASLESIKKKIS